MSHNAKVLADSISPDGVRLTTLEVTFPRSVLAEFNTHRVFSRNSASSRAIPVEKMIRMVQENPYIPTHWGKNQKGMQADEELGEEEQARALLDWNAAKLQALKFAGKLLGIGIHKQITNRLLEPFMWHTVIVTSTEWSNWDHLRANKDASPEIQRAAELMLQVRAGSEPKKLRYSDWHLPLVDPGEVQGTYKHIAYEPVDDIPRLMNEAAQRWCKISVGRCARVSYLTHDGRRDPQADVELCDRLLASGHMSPFEHVARPMTEDERWLFRQPRFEWDASKQRWRPVRDEKGICLDSHFLGNFDGWVQFRKLIPHEHDILGKEPQ